MNPRFVGPLIVTFGLGVLLGVLLMSCTLRVEVDPMVPVVVAARDMELGYAITNPNADLKIVLWPERIKPNGVCDNIEELRGRTLARSVRAGDSLNLRDLVLMGFGIFPDLDPPDPAKSWRAITIRSHEPFGVCPRLGPGCRVDIIGTHAEMSCKIVLENMLVLAVQGEVVTVLARLDDVWKLLSHYEMDGHFVLLHRRPVVDASTDSAGGQP